MPEPEPRLPSLPPLEPGTVLAGKYRIERVIGRGDMGIVVEVRHVALEERVALKLLIAENALNPEASSRSLDEAQTAVKIKSEHVARVSEVGTLDQGAPYTVMELLVGEDLSKVLQACGPLPLQDAVDYLIQACEAIAEAHAQGIVHCDLKPSNLFLTRRPDGSPLVKVLDFGISKIVSDTRVDHLTRTAAAMGSALYMPPEQMQEPRSIDQRTDIYALGISLFELLAGRQPFYAETLPQLCAEILTGTPTPLHAFRPEIPSAFAAALERAYAHDRRLRYRSVVELVLALFPFAPARSWPIVERIGQMGDLDSPGAGDSEPYPLSDTQVSGEGHAGAGEAASTNPPTSQPPTGTTPMPKPPAGTAPRLQLPAGIMLISGGPRPSGMLASALPEVVSRIIPGPYIGPSSARAAATFAAGRMSALEVLPRRRGRNLSSLLLITTMVAGALLFGVIVGVLALRRPPVAGPDAPATSAHPRLRAPHSAPKPPTSGDLNNPH